MSFKFKKWHLLIGALILLLITNPSNSDFKSYLQGKHPSSIVISNGKTLDLFLFSIHKGSADSNGYMCIGVLKNFIVLEHSKIHTIKEEQESIMRNIR
jgi:hypothetical protein